MPKRIQVLPPEDCYVLKLTEMDYEVVLVHKPVYACLSCQQVWALKWHAETCMSRDHRSTIEQEYHFNWTDVPKTYVWRSLRQESASELVLIRQPEPRKTQRRRSVRLDPEWVNIMRRDKDRYIVEATFKPVYKCGGCGLVWPLQQHADICGIQGHVNYIVQEYYVRRRNHAPTMQTHVYYALRHEALPPKPHASIYVEDDE